MNLTWNWKYIGLQYIISLAKMMKLWKVVYYKNVEVWLNKLDQLQLKFLAKELRLLELGGYQLKLPHSKALGNGLFELRERKYGLRIYYSFCKGKVILLLNAGNKSTQTRDISVARKLLIDYEGEVS